ncbi:MAG: serine/threonine protein phosphatase [Actinobacteria bacterium]|nr:serine/threonine protein phosphatase [Actinomycetota bacterium]
MRTDQRLTRAYEGARVEVFDASSRYVFMSDCHRGSGGLSDEFSRNENCYLHALEHYFREGYTLVEVGDGDELWEHPDFKSIKDAHEAAFRAMRRFFDADRFILIWGNHNNYLRKPKFVAENLATHYHDHSGITHDLFAGIQAHEALVLKERDTGQEVLVVHGHQGDFVNDQAWFLGMASLRFFWGHLHAFGAHNPTSPAENVLKRHRIERSFTEWIAKHKRALICGHTHRFKYPTGDDLPYFNTGCCVYPTTLTALELANDAIRLVGWRVEPDSDGVLRVERHVLRGPDSVARFDIR